MHIVIGRTTNIHADESPKKSVACGPLKNIRRERRKNRQDRRKSVRDGVIVSLSFKNDRRVCKDRRRRTAGHNRST